MPDGEIRDLLPLAKGGANQLMPGEPEAELSRPVAVASLARAPGTHTALT
jgi:hypothetical protein